MTTYGWFIEGFDIADLQEAKALIGPLPNAHVIDALGRVSANGAAD